MYENISFSNSLSLLSITRWLNGPTTLTGPTSLTRLGIIVVSSQCFSIKSLGGYLGLRALHDNWFPLNLCSFSAGCDHGMCSSDHYYASTLAFFTTRLANQEGNFGSSSSGYYCKSLTKYSLDPHCMQNHYELDHHTSAPPLLCTLSEPQIVVDIYHFIQPVLHKVVFLFVVNQEKFDWLLSQPLDARGSRSLVS